MGEPFETSVKPPIELEVLDRGAAKTGPTTAIIVCHGMGQQVPAVAWLRFTVKRIIFCQTAWAILADEANDSVGNINKLTEGEKTAIALFIATRAALDAITKYSDNRALRGIQVQEWLACREK